MMRKYSVLMSVYFKENPDFLSASIESMLLQTEMPDEIVIVKDGPLPAALEKILSYYRNQFPTLFTFVELEENGGLGRALNNGLKVCRNELIARMDTDDISLSTRCKLQLDEFEKDDKLCIVGTQINEFIGTVDNIVSSRQVPLSSKEIKIFARRRSPFNHPTVMYKKTEVLRCGAYPELKRKEDLRLFSVMVNNECKAYNIPKVLLLYRSSIDNYQRRKTWINCKEYINVIYMNYKDGYCNYFDYLYVVIGQLFLFCSPVWLMKKLSGILLRKKAIEIEF